MPCYVILQHDWPERHWDLLLEAGPVLKAWRLRSLPEVGQAVEAQPNADHRLIYLDYEGPVSGDRGSVQRVDVGTFESFDGIYQLKSQRTGQTGLLRQCETGWVFYFAEGIPLGNW